MCTSVGPCEDLYGAMVSPRYVGTYVHSKGCIPTGTENFRAGNFLCVRIVTWKCLPTRHGPSVPGGGRKQACMLVEEALSCLSGARARQAWYCLPVIPSIRMYICIRSFFSKCHQHKGVIDMNVHTCLITLSSHLCHPMCH